MPRFDGTGPFGQGPMTGRAAGYCVGSPVPGYMNSVPGRGGFGCGRGFGRGYGRGRGFGQGFRQRWADPGCGYGAGYGNPYSAQGVSVQDEARILKDQARAMQEEITMINQRIKDLESHPGSESNE